jgi:capsular polysaccharide export protein
LQKGEKKYYLKIVNNQNTYKGVSIEHCIRYHCQLSDTTSVLDLKLQALAYIDLFEAIFYKNKPAFVICLGDTRMCTYVASTLARRMNIEVRFIEQGPFNRTFFDHLGVNANLSVRQTFDPKSTQVPTLKVNISKTEPNYLRSPFYRVCDILLFKLFQKRRFYPPDLKYTDVNSLLFRSRQNRQLSYENENFRFLLICQLPRDVNSVVHSPHFSSTLELLKSAYKALPPKAVLVVREHPLYIGKYGTEFYDFMKEKGIKTENNIPLKTALNTSKVVIVNNSTVGFEAICHYKPTVVLGDAFYDHPSLCLKLKDKTDLNSLLTEALTYHPDKVAIDRFNAYLFKSSLIEGGIKERSLRASQTIAERLLNSC